MTPEDFTDAAFMRAREYECEELTAEAYKRARTEALEEAIVAVANFENDIGDLYVKRIAAAIRALK